MTESQIAYVIDDDEAVRHSLGTLNSVLGHGAESYESAEQFLEDFCPDWTGVLFVDLRLPGISGLEATRDSKRRRPKVAILPLTVHRSDEYFFRTLQAGALGYVLKGADPGDLISGVRTVHRGEVFLYPSMAKKLVTDYLDQARRGEVSPPYDDLTDREVEVLRLIAEGHTTGEIGEMLALSPHTVQSHRRHIMKKLNLHDRIDLVKYAIRRQLIEF